MLIELLHPCLTPANLENMVLQYFHIPISMTSPYESHWYEIKRILCYLSGTITHALLLTPTTLPHKLSLRAYIDLD